MTLEVIWCWLICKGYQQFVGDANCEAAVQRQTSASASSSDAALSEMSKKITTTRKSTSKPVQTKSNTPDDHKSSECWPRTAFLLL